MQKQAHKIPLSGAPSQLEELEKQGHGGVVEISRNKEGVITGSVLVCTEDHTRPKTLTENVEESFTRKPRLSEAERLMEEIGGV